MRFILLSGFSAIIMQWASLNITAQPPAYPLTFWSGALTSESIKVNVKLTKYCPQVRMALSTDSIFSNPVYSEKKSADSSKNFMISFEMGGLQPSTKYYYAFELNYSLNLDSGKIGSFVTPAGGPFSYRFTFNSCVGNFHNNYSNMMKAHDPLFWICTGDLHYGDPNSTDVNVHRNFIEGTVLLREPMKSFIRNVPVAYIWDDHDFCGNDSDSSFIGKESARQAYRDYVPHYFLPDGGGAIYQAFTIGRVRFIMTDLRSTKSPGAMMPRRQHEWFKKELLYARDSQMMAIWISSMPWLPPVHPENWGAYPAERRGIGNFLRDNQIKNLMILTGDAHMLAIDDGTNSDFSTGQTNPYKYPVFNAAAVAKGGSTKGGTYSHGRFRNPNSFVSQYGLVRVFDNGGDTICFSLEGYRTDTIGSYDSLIVNYSFCRTFSQSLDAYLNEPFITPNPATTEVSILLPVNTPKLEIRMTDLKGRKVWETTLTGFENQLAYTLNLPPDKKGAFLLTLQTSSRVYHKKIIIQ